MKNASTGKTIPADKTDWPRVRAMKDREISHDVDSPATTAPDWDGAVLRQGGVELGKARTRGPNRSPTKEQVAIRYNPEVIAAFRASGSGWQTRMNNALEDWLKSHSPANV
jgi:uncharacterized protein (DUF4415 family)